MLLMSQDARQEDDEFARAVDVEKLRLGEIGRQASLGKQHLMAMAGDFPVGENNAPLFATLCPHDGKSFL
jgi:hypothetical protein